MVVKTMVFITCRTSNSEGMLLYCGLVVYDDYSVDCIQYMYWTHASVCLNWTHTSVCLNWMNGVRPVVFSVPAPFTYKCQHSAVVLHECSYCVIHILKHFVHIYSVHADRDLPVPVA